MMAEARTQDRSVADYIASVREIGPLLEAEAAGNDETGKLSERSVAAMRDTGLLDVLTPAELGGPELGPFDSLQVLSEIFRFDGSAGWIAMVQNTQLTTISALEHDTVKAMFANGTPGLAGQGAPGGTGVEVEGGYRVNGRWSYASNILHSDYVSGTVVLVQDGKPVPGPTGAPRMIRFVTPRDTVELKGNWDVLGMRASGSQDFVATDLFVPHAYTMRAVVEGPRAPTWKRPKMSPVGWLLWAHSLVELGMGLRILEEIAAFSRQPSRGTRLVDDPVFRAEFAKAEGRYLSARAWFFEIWRDIQETTERGEFPSRRQMTLARTALLHANVANTENVTFAFREAGGTSLRAGTLQRLFRDHLTAGQHMMASRKTWEDCGRELLDEADGLDWGPFSLMQMPTLPKAS